MFKKSVSLFLALTLLFSAFVLTHAEESIPGDNKIITEENTNEETQDFADDVVLVSIYHNISLTDKIFTVEDFPEVDITKVEYLTTLPENPDDYPLLNTDKYCHILSLHLAEPSKENVVAAVEILKQNEYIESASYDYLIYEETIVPNDTDYSNQYVLKNINIEGAWNYTKGSKDVKVGIIDSGIASHPDLNANVVKGWDFGYNNDITTDDTRGHGTTVASVIGAVGNNSKGMAGICWNVSLVPLQVLDRYNDSYQISLIVNAIQYAIDNNIKILNISLNLSNTAELKNIISRYKGLIIASAGNNSTDNDITPHYPSSYEYDNIIAVASSNTIDELAAHSNYGVNSVDIAAPGTNVYTARNDGTYKHNGGTSLAAPMVTGVAALLLSYNPNLTPAEIKNIILSTVDKIPALSGKVASGGRLNAQKALAYVLEGNKVRNYKFRIRANISSPVTSSNVEVKYETDYVRYVDYTPGELFNKYNSGSILKIKDNTVNYLHRNTSYPLTSSGIYCIMRFDTVYKNYNCVTKASTGKSEFFNASNSPVSVPLSTICVLAGDVNSDGVVDANDSSLILNYLAEGVTFTDRQLFAGDVDGDGKCDVNDSTRLLRYLAEWYDSLMP